MNIPQLSDHLHLTADGTKVRILDQSLLPGREVYLELSALDEMCEAIKSLRVRGAPAIGIFAGYCIYVLAYHCTIDGEDFLKEMHESAEKVRAARPTAVNLAHAVDRMVPVLDAYAPQGREAVLDALLNEALAIHEEDIASCTAIAEYGLTLIKDGDGILTHCNAGEIATSRYGTGLGPLLLGAERGMKLRAYCDETRPLLQGARLTMWELMKAGVDATLICDNMASFVMKSGKINAVFTGCDRVAANGDAANKIGTSGAAIIAKHYGVPMYVFCPSTTIDFSCRTGDDIKIEMRDGAEITTKHYTASVAPEGAKTLNPAFDVTPAELITAIITERGIARYPYEKSLRELFPEEERK